MRTNFLTKMRMMKRKLKNRNDLFLKNIKVLITWNISHYNFFFPNLSEHCIAPLVAHFSAIVELSLKELVEEICLTDFCFDFASLTLNF